MRWKEGVQQKETLVLAFTFIDVLLVVGADDKAITKERKQIPWERERLGLQFEKIGWLGFFAISTMEGFDDGFAGKLSSQVLVHILLIILTSHHRSVGRYVLYEEDRDPMAITIH